MKRFILLIFLASFLTVANSQIAYLASNGQNNTGTYTDMGTNGTAITNNFAGSAMTYDDDNSSIQNIGFSFEFNSTIFTQFVLNTNGFIKLGNKAPLTTNIFYTTTSGTNGGCINAVDSNLIYPFNHDLQGATAPEYRVYTSGAAPNRVCTIQYKNLKDKMNTGGTDLQYANMNFQIKLYETSNNVEFIYSAFTITGNASLFKTAAVGLKANNAANSINVTKGSSTSWTAATFINGDYGGNYFNNRNSTLPDAGRTYRFVALLVHDIAVTTIWTQSKVATTLSNPVVITANIGNLGNTTMNNVTATLTVTGANNFTDTKALSSILAAFSPGVYPTVTFNGFNPVNMGTNHITVTLSSDDVTTNNSLSVQQEVTADKMSYVFNGTADGGYNFTNQLAGDVVAKFKTNSSTAINQVKVGFISAGVPCQAIIWDATGMIGKPGAILWQSPIVTSVTGIMTFNVSPLITVNGNFYVGGRLPNGGLGGIAYETENPVRASTFMYQSPTGGTSWGDFGNYGYYYRPMIEVQFSTTVLPVKFLDFTAKDNGSNILLHWATANETNNKNFEIQRSTNGIDFNTIGLANTSLSNEYNFTDISIASLGNTVFYRLKQNSTDGQFVFSSIVKVNRRAGNSFVMTAINPTRNKIVVQLQSSEAKNIQLTIVNTNGQVLLKQQAITIIGSSTIILDNNSNQLAKGLYFIKANIGKEVKVIKVVKE